MRRQFIGCGDAFGSGGRFNTCFHLVTPATVALIDCGASSLPALKRCGVDRNAIDVMLADLDSVPYETAADSLRIEL